MPAADRDAELKIPEVDAGDTAHAETRLPLAAEVLAAFIADGERLLRLNPQLAIERWAPEADGFRLVAENESNGRRLDTRVLIERRAQTLTLRYASGLKRATEFAIVPGSDGIRLVVTETYPRIADPADPRVADVDKSLVPWVAALRRHLLARLRWGWLPGWHWWHERFMPGMPPRQRRIVRLLLWSTVLEFAVFVGLVLGLRFVS